MHGDSARRALGAIAMHLFFYLFFIRRSAQNEEYLILNNHNNYCLVHILR